VGTEATPGPTATAALEPGEALPRLGAGQPLTITVVEMLTAAEGWGIGHGENNLNDHVLRTSDGGATWTDVSPPQRANEAGQAAIAEFRGEVLAWVTYHARDVSTDEAAVVWRTEDGGTTWAASTPLDMSDMEFYVTSDLTFADDQNGWLMAHVGAGMSHDYVVAFATSDGGLTWSRVVDPFSIAESNLQQSCLKTGLAFLNPETGWAAGDCQGVAPGVFFQRSDDGGRTWRAQVLPAPPERPDAFERQDGSCGTYNLAPMPPNEVLVAVTCVTYTDTIETEHFLYASADGGESWEAWPLPAPDYDWLDRKTGWTIEPEDPNSPEAVRQLYQTTDGGRTWAEVGSVAWTAQLDFVDATRGFAVARAGEDTALVETTTGGESWGLVEPESGP
jgi:photosystem II stability/assembly factor-like uncharacterized protein